MTTRKSKLTNDCEVGDFIYENGYDDGVTYLVTHKIRNTSKQTKDVDNICKMVGHHFGLKGVTTKMCETYLRGVLL